MTEPALSFVGVWTALIALGVFLYVLLDGFDLGVGMLHGFARDTAERELIMNTIAPIWDGNETWLVFCGVALLAAFPLAFAIIIPAVYFPILVMLIALVFRGVAFEFRFRGSRPPRLLGPRLSGRLVRRGFRAGHRARRLYPGVPGRGAACSAAAPLDFLTPFSMLTGLALLFGYGLLGAGWLIIKTEGALQEWARRQGRLCLIGVVIGIAVVSLWTPLMEHADRRALVLAAQYPVSLAGADRHSGGCRLGMAGALRRRLTRPLSSPRSCCSCWPISASRSACGR